MTEKLIKQSKYMDSGVFDVFLQKHSLFGIMFLIYVNPTLV